MVQRKFIPHGDKAKEFLQLIKYNSTQQEKIKTVDDSNDLNVTVMVEANPPANWNDEILGVTYAVVDTNTDRPVILNGSVAPNRATLPSQLRDMSRMEIFVSIYENMPVRGVSEPIPLPKQLFSMIHEFERHVFPFVDLYTSIRAAQFNNEVLSDDRDFARLSDELLQDPSPHGSLAQHVSADLAARTRITQENILGSLERASVNDEERMRVTNLGAQLGQLLDLDTGGRGVDMDAMNHQYALLRESQQ